MIFTISKGRIPFFYFILIFCLLHILFEKAEAKEWNGITPLKSTRADVEKLFGKQRERGGYEINGMFVRFQYLEKKCESKSDCECWVGEDTVLEIHVYIHNELKLEQLKLNLGRYKKKSDKHLLDRFYYSNLEEGIIYEVSKDENRILSILYLPSKDDCRNLLKP